MAPGQISCELTWSPSSNKVFELNWITLHNCKFHWCTKHSTRNMSSESRI